MGKSRKMLLAAGAMDIRSRALSAVRPGVEALLLSAVALGCAQAGWSVLTPGNAGALSAPTSDDQDNVRRDMVDVQSPFAPIAASDAQSHAIAALLSSMTLNGVRMSDDPTRSGAVITLGDGVQHAVAVGEELSAGVSLSEVGADYVLVSYAGGRQQVSLASPQPYSFARALMGQAQTASPPVDVSAPAPVVAAPAIVAQAGAVSPFAVGASAPTAPPAMLSNAAASEAPPAVDVVSAPDAISAPDGAWLQATLANTETDEAGLRGWRLADPLPQAAVAAGLRAGDLIEAVNGARPGDVAGLIAAGQATSFELAVVRAGERMTLTIAASGRT